MPSDPEQGKQPCPHNHANTAGRGELPGIEPVAKISLTCGNTGLEYESTRNDVKRPAETLNVLMASTRTAPPLSVPLEAQRSLWIRWLADERRSGADVVSWTIDGGLSGRNT
jgi:hypothetical protein